MATKTIELPLDAVTVEFYVRRALSDDRVMELALLLEAGTVLPPILINEEHQVIDGRHRLEAHKLAERKTITCEVRKNLDLGQQLLEALKANMGGAMPPTQSNIRLAIQNMLGAGMSSSAIQKGLTTLPPSVARKYISEAQSNMAHQRMRAAVEAVTDQGMRVQDAAEKFAIDVEDLKTEIRGKKKQLTTAAFGMPKIKAGLSKRYRSCSQANAKLFTRMIEGYGDGECTFNTVLDTLNVTEKMITNQLENLAGWRQRLNAARRNQEGGQ